MPRNTRRTTKKSIVESEESTGPVPEINTAKFAIVALIGGKISKLPVSGKSYYFVVDVSEKDVTVLHPFTFVKCTLNRKEYWTAVDKNEWLPTPEKVVDMLNKKAQTEHELKRQVPAEVAVLVKHFEQEAMNGR